MSEYRVSLLSYTIYLFYLLVFLQLSHKSFLLINHFRPVMKNLITLPPSLSSPPCAPAIMKPGVGLHRIGGRLFYRSSFQLGYRYERGLYNHWFFLHVPMVQPNQDTQEPHCVFSWPWFYHPPEPTVSYPL